MNILGHCCYIGETGYAIHSRNFFREFSKKVNLKIRNFSVDKNWQGLHNENPYGDSINDIDKNILALQYHNTHEGYKDFPVFNGIKDFHQDIDIVLVDCYHHFYYSQYPNKKIFYIAWEKNKYPDDFFEKLKEADQVWVPSEWQAAITIKQGIEKSKVKVVPEGIDPDVYCPNSQLKNKKFTFLVVGKWEKRKSTEEIIKCFDQVFNSNDPVELQLMCDNNFSSDGFKSTEERVNNLKIKNKNIKIIHFTEKNEYLKILKAANVFLSCSRSEGWNLPLIEAMACGIPSIYSNCSGQLEFAQKKGIPIKIHGEIKDINNENNGYYEPDFNDLRNKILEAYLSYDFYKQKALDESHQIRNRFTWENAAKIAFNNVNELLNKNKVKIINESGSLGDFIAWTPIVARYAKEKNVIVDFYTPHKNLFSEIYPEINFYDYNFQKEENYFHTFYLGCTENINWRNMSLQEIACSILDLDYREEKPRSLISLKKKNNFSKKYVCIATQSTSQCKYWNNKDGWTKTVNYLKSLGYEVVCIDKYQTFGIDKYMNEIPGNCLNKTGDISLLDRINDLLHCDFFIGLGSGLSWLAWACGKPVIMISGFSDPKSEFYTAYRVHNKDACNSCWNDSSLEFERNNWLWCPRNKNFECSKEISFEMVKEKIDKCIFDLNTQKDTHVIVHHYNEDLTWLKNINYPYTIYSRTQKNQENVNFLDHDKGVEAFAYLKFIIDNYDNLPENMIFVHAHRISWHQDDYIDNIINKLDLSEDFLNFNNCNIIPFEKNEPETVEEHYYHRLNCRSQFRRSYKLWFEDIWNELFHNEIILPEKIECKAAAQFLVNKKNVLKRSKAFYINIVNWLMNTDIDEKLKITKSNVSLSSQISGRILEAVWYLIFKK